MSAAPFIPTEWHCHHRGCLSHASGVGTPFALLFLGWGFNKTETKIFCPTHHPGGPEQVELQSRAAVIFMKISARLDHASPTYDPGLLIDLYRMAGEVGIEGVVGVLPVEN